MYKIKNGVLVGFMIISISLTLATPVVAHAAWWNPVSWFKAIVAIIMPSKEKAPERVAEKPQENAQSQTAQNSGPKNASSSTSTPRYQAAMGNEDRSHQNTNAGANGSNTGASNTRNGQGNTQNADSNTAYFDETPEYRIASSSNPQSHSVCPDTYQPMCGTDGVTYRNYCELQNAGATYNYGSACVAPSSAGSSVGSTSGSNPNSSAGAATSGSNTSASGVSAGTSATTGTDTSAGLGAASGSGTPTASFSCGLSANPSQSVNLRNRTGSFYYRPIPAIAGADIKWYTDIINTGPDDMGEWRSENVGIGTRCFSTVYYQIDLNSNNTWDVTLKADMGQLRATDPNMVDHLAYKTSPTWKAVAGNHRWRICADGANKVDENNETDNCVEGTIEVR